MSVNENSDEIVTSRKNRSSTLKAEYLRKSISPIRKSPRKAIQTRY